MKVLIKCLTDLGSVVSAGPASVGPDDLYLGSPKGRNRRTTIVGIFDNARDLDRALERLARAGFEDMVYDEAIVGEEPLNLGTLIFAPGQASPVVWGNVERTESPQPDLQTVLRAFKAHLADYRLPAEVIEAYATTFCHKGEFVLIRANSASAGQAIKILQECGATRVNRHD